MSRPEQDNYKKEGGLVLGLSMYRRQTLANYTVVSYHSLHVLKVRSCLSVVDYARTNLYDQTHEENKTM